MAELIFIGLVFLLFMFLALGVKFILNIIFFDLTKVFSRKVKFYEVFIVLIISLII